MKKAILLALIATVLFSCNDSKQKVSAKKAGRTETQTSIIIKDTATKSFFIRFAFRVVESYPKIVDSVNLKSEWVNDTLYAVEMSAPLIDTLTNKQKLDTAGSPLFNKWFQLLSKDLIVYDANFDVQAAMKKEFGDTTKQK